MADRSQMALLGIGLNSAKQEKKRERYRNKLLPSQVTDLGQIVGGDDLRVHHRGSKNGNAPVPNQSKLLVCDAKCGCKALANGSIGKGLVPCPGGSMGSVEEREGLEGEEVSVFKAECALSFILCLFSLYVMTIKEPDSSLSPSPLPFSVR